MTATVRHIDPGRQEWREEALCREVDLETFFPRDGENGHAAKRVCALCLVRSECLDDALARPTWADQHGIWGGLSPGERDKLRKRGRR